ncbi:hypothetical protein GGD50_003252 [Rhizobium paranaense]|uniref:Uncharacterized protein n=1 Tax=Rhizobium paranaense TaxID=1650438 RepID=A0A7W9D1W1_9HYPH|nr:hypothetical protein [Rhizobium paranaense]
MFVMGTRQAEEGQRLLDDLLDPAGQPRIFARRFGEPGRKVGLGLGEIASVVDPSEFLQAIVAVLARQVVERIPEEMHVTALPGRFRYHFADCRDQSGMVVGDDELHTPETRRLSNNGSSSCAPNGISNISRLSRDDQGEFAPIIFQNRLARGISGRTLDSASSRKQMSAAFQFQFVPDF